MDPQYPNKRHHHHHHPSPLQPPSQSKPSSTEAHFRILCPAGKAGGVIGKGGAVIRQLREDTGARIRIIDDYPPSHCDERIILISAPLSPNPNPNGEEERENESKMTVAQAALFKVFERILKVDEERGEAHNHYHHQDGNSDSNSSINNGGNNNGENGEGKGGGEGHHGSNVVCRMLAWGNQIGSVLGRGGKIVEKIRQDSGAIVRIMSREALPSCASPGDELIQIAGHFQVVKKALLLISSCLQEHPVAEFSQGANITSKTDSFPQRGSHATDHHSRGFMAASTSENFGPNHRFFPEEELVFKMLCPVERIGNVIGKGGFVIRGIQNETGASIKINDPVAPDSDERVVVISAREGIDLKRSPAQDAVFRVHSRIAESGFEPGAAVVARLLVPSQQIGCLLGKGGHIVNEMRRTTGANIRIFGRDHSLKTSSPNEEVVQVIGNIQTVQDALFQITSRIREIVIPPRPHYSQVSNSSYLSTFSESLSPSFRPRHDQASPSHYHSSVGLAHGYDSHSFGQGPIHPSSFSHGTDRTGELSGEPDYHHFGDERAPAPYGPSFDQSPSPRAWYPQGVNNGHPSRFSNAGVGPSEMMTSNSESSQMQVTTSVEVVVPQVLLPHVYGENRSNLSHITQYSGADVVVHDPKPGATEGRVLISGTPKQLYTAQSLVQAFIYCGQAY